MNTIWLIIKFIIANTLLIILSSTLIGLILRSLLQPRLNKNQDWHKSEYNKLSIKNGIVISVISLVVSIILIFSIYWKMNILISAGFFICMITRVKDLLNEIKTGKITSRRTMTKEPLDFVLNLFFWGGFLIFNYGLYKYWVK